jgi:hypothetical protein
VCSPTVGPINSNRLKKRNLVVNISWLVKRIIAIVFVSFFLQGIHYALMDCLKHAHPHEEEHEQEIVPERHPSRAEQGGPAANIHCVDSRLHFGISIPSGQQNLSQRLAKRPAPVWDGVISLVINPGAFPIISRSASNFTYLHTTSYLVFSVLRI